MLQENRTSFDKGYRKVACVVPNDSASVYDLLVSKYGGDNVFRATSLSAEVAFHNAQSVLSSNSNDAILVFPGTYTPAATIAISKNIAVKGATDTCESINIDGATNTITTAVFTLAATADYSAFAKFKITKLSSAAGFIIPSTAPGVVIDDVAVDCTTTSSTDVCISNAAANVRVTNCKFRGSLFAIDHSASGGNCLYANNYIVCTTASAVGIVNPPVGINLRTGQDNVVQGNIFSYATTSAICVKVGTTGKVDRVQIADNLGGTYTVATVVLTTPVHFVNASTGSMFKNYKNTIGDTLSVMTAVVTA